MRHLSSPAINKSLVPGPSFCSPVHKYLTGLGLSLKTKLSPVPKYVRVLGPVVLSLQLDVTKPPMICGMINTTKLIISQFDIKRMFDLLQKPHKCLQKGFHFTGRNKSVIGSGWFRPLKWRHHRRHYNPKNKKSDPDLCTFHHSWWFNTKLDISPHQQMIWLEELSRHHLHTCCIKFLYWNKIKL